MLNKTVDKVFLIVTVKVVYGKKMVYPANDIAQIFADISGQKTLSIETLKHAKALGYEIVVEAEILDLS